MKPVLKSLIGMMDRRAESTPGRTAFTFENRSYSFALLWSWINRLGGRLQDLGVERGDRGVVVVPNGPGFFEAFYGLLRTGAAAVPLFPDSGPERIAAIARMCRAKVVIAPAQTPGELPAGLRKTLGAEIPLVTVPLGRAGEDAPVEPGHPFPDLGPDDLALIQYTSGSTGNPKGVQISHGNLLTNMNQMIAGMAITERDVFVSWLPVYHDMGLILMTMIPFLLAAELHLLPTDLRDTRRWLAAIQAHRATFTAAPDFAYRLCLSRLSTPGEFDLSSLRVALNAAEMVRPRTILDFETAFGLKNVMAPGYGLAEATVGVSTWPPGGKVAVDRRGFVSVGPPFPEVELKIVTDGESLPSGEIGEVLVKSPANARGYLDNPEENEKLFAGDGFLATGDLGYLDGAGNLYIVGRRKNIIVRAGGTVSPREIEEIVDNRPAVRYSAAVGVDRGRAEGEQVYVFAEIRDNHDRTGETLEDLTRSMVLDVHANLGFRPARIYLVKPRTITLTHNGKIQYPRLKESYLSGDLRRRGRILFPDF